MRRLKRIAAAVATAAVATLGAVESGVLRVPEWARQGLTALSIVAASAAPSALPRPKGSRAPDSKPPAGGPP